MKKINVVLVLLMLVSSQVFASSHREAPGITRSPQVDATDFYMFRSYESGREGYTTLIANYNPLQDPVGGPNYFPLDPSAAYDIHVTNNGDTEEDLTFRFKVNQESSFFPLMVGEGEEAMEVAIPLVNKGAFASDDESNLNVKRSFTLQLIRGKVTPKSAIEHITKKGTDEEVFAIPFDNIGNKSIPNYQEYADSFIYDVSIPGCSDGRVFVGQRKESFAVNLGEIFDLVNIADPVGAPDAETSSTEFKNITTLALEIPTECLTEGKSDIIAAWTTSSLPRNRSFTKRPSFDRPDIQSGRFVQVSRLGNPLVNEVVIGLPDKNKFNASHPSRDTQFLKYVTNPTLPELLEILFGVTAPNLFPRADLVQVFLTGVPGLTEDGSVGEMMRLNTTIAPINKEGQNNLGVIAGDVAGYPNGRRPGDDVVDISLRAVMGVLLPAEVAPHGALPFTDGVLQNAEMFDDTFPYLKSPLAGSIVEEL